MTGLLIFVVVYVLVTVAGLVFSFAGHRSGLRLGVRIVAGILFVPILPVGALMIFIRSLEPPSLDSLQTSFPARQSDLNALVRMSNEDVRVARIAPDWLDQTTSGKWEQHMAGDPMAALSTSRWDTYRTVFSRNGIKLGLQRNAFGDVFVMSDSIGLLNRGHTTGYLYCGAPRSQRGYRYPPCALGDDKGEQKFSSNPRRDAYSFKKVADHWYVYDEGPS
jgi:hypothetical protein